MAVMWPQQLPLDVLGNPRRSTEVGVYRKLAECLDDSWSVFYSRPWLGLAADGAEKDGECDFVVANPQMGMLCLEVKGGAVAWNPQTGQWTSRDRNGITHRIKDPVEQARSSKHELLGKLKRVPALRTRWITARHGVVLPGSVNPGTDLGLDRPLHIFCFSDTYERGFGQWLAARLGHDEREGMSGCLGPDGIAALQQLLAKPFELKLSLGPIARAEDREIEFLTQQQFHLLEAIRDLPRVLIHGGAGTGKTLLASHLAQTLAASGVETLLVCYNRPLAQHLASLTAGTPQLTIQSFHQLCASVVLQAGHDLPAEDGATADYFSESLPRAAEACAFDPAVRRFDAVIVDEGQDFKDTWWLVLEALFRPDGPAVLRVFADNNQRVYGNAIGMVRDLQLAPIALSWNLRNTQSIHEAAYRYYQGASVRCGGPMGEPPTLVTASDRSSVVREAIQLARSLTMGHAVEPEELAILVPDQAWRTDLVRQASLVGIRTGDAVSRTDGAIVVDTVRRFKGLEALVAIAVVDASVSASEELTYVALSRARARIFLAGQQRHLRALSEVQPAVP